MKQFDITRKYVDSGFNYLLEHGFSEAMAKFVFVVLTIVVLISVGWLLNNIIDKISRWIAKRSISKLNQQRFPAFIIKWKAGNKLGRILVAYRVGCGFCGFNPCF